MNILAGVTYNLRGLCFGLKTPRLLFWGLIRFVGVIIITVICSGLVLVYHQQIMELIWKRPESQWIIWLWYVLSWFASLILVGISAVVSYLISQVLFSVVIMDRMSRITEFKMTGQVTEPHQTHLWRLFVYLIRQELPRTILPVSLSLFLMILGSILPPGTILIFLTSAMAAIFLAWDNTDLVPARRLVPFKDRFLLLLKALPFHLGFGLLFLIPGLNILFLSFAPIGATMYFLEKYDRDTVKKAALTHSGLLAHDP